MNSLFAQIYSYLHGIWTYRWSALIVSWVVGIIGCIVVYVLPNQYTSTAVMHIDTDSVIRPLLKGLAVHTSVEKELGILKRRLLSERSLEKVVRQTDLSVLATDDDAMSRLVLDLATSLVFTGKTQSRKDKKARKEAKAIYTLSLEGRSPELVHQIVSKSLEILVENTLKSARDDSGTLAAQEFLNQQIVEHENRLNAAEQKLLEFTRENIGFMPGETGGYYDKFLREQEQLANMTTELKTEELRLAEMRKQLKGELPLHSELELTKMRAYREELQDLLTQYTESHPDVLSLRAIIAELLAKDNSEPVVLGLDDLSEVNPAYQALKTETRNVSIEVETMKAKLLAQKAKVASLKASVNVIPEIEANLAKLNRDYNLTKKRYLRIVEKREAVMLAEAVGQSGQNINFRILVRPTVAEEPSGPNRLQFMSIVFAAALVSGMLWGFVRYALRPTYIFLRQMEDQIGLPILGTVGLYVTEKHKHRRKRQLKTFFFALSLLVVAYGINMYMLLGLTIDDILLALQSSAI